MTNSTGYGQALQRIDALVHQVCGKIGAPNTPTIDDEVQDELSKSIVILQNIKRCLIRAESRKQQAQLAQLESMIVGLEAAIAVLLEKPYEFHFARRLRRDAEFAVREYQNPIAGRVINAFKYVLYESSTAVKVLVGLVLGIPVVMILGLSPRLINYQGFVTSVVVTPLVTKECAKTNLDNCDALTKSQINESLALLAVVTIAGALGGITSTLIRIKEFENEKYTDSVLPVYIGLIRPFIGAAFGVLAFVLLSSKLLPLQINESQDSVLGKWYSFFAIAFVAGFSERLVKDMISQTEERFLPGSDPDASSASQLNPKNMVLLPVSELKKLTAPQVERSERSIDDTSSDTKSLSNITNEVG
jgi:hypothetical protein